MLLADRLAIAAIALVLIAPKAARAQASPNDPDSLVLERTACLGTCPVYRLSLRRDGSVVFEDRPTSSEVRRATGTSLPGGWAHLLKQIERVRFFDLPEEIIQDRGLCSVAITDAPSGILSVFHRGSVKRVKHYHGCAVEIDPWTVAPTLRELSLLAAAVDSVGRVNVWLSP